MNNPSGMSQAEMMALMYSLKPMPCGHKDRAGSKPKHDRAKRRKKNRAARRARARNRG